MGDEIDWASLRSGAFALAGNAQTTPDTYPAIRLALSQLGDQHSFFQTPEEAKLLSQARIKNLGLIAEYPGGVIMQVYPGGPAELAGLHAGDIIEAVNGEPIQPDERRPLLVAIDHSSQTRLTIKPNGQDQLLEIALDPTEYSIEGLPQGTLLSDNIGYIELPQFLGGDEIAYAETVQEIIQASDEQGACGWVVDIRRNRGGNVWLMLAGIGPLLGEGDAGWFIDKAGVKEIWSYRDGKALLNNETMASINSYALKTTLPPVAVLTGPLTASSGEMILISFRGRPNTRSFGEATLGVPTANFSKELSDGAMLILTVAWEADRTGQIYKDRIQPDEFVDIDWAVFGTEQDAVIQAAVDWLQTQSGCTP
jgi:C-terminal processing protease CtpA/Prc